MEAKHGVTLVWLSSRSLDVLIPIDTLKQGDEPFLCLETWIRFLRSLRETIHNVLDMNIVQKKLFLPRILRAS